MKITDNYIIVSSENNEGLWCPYGSMNTFLENWKLNKDEMTELKRPEKYSQPWTPNITDSLIDIIDKQLVVVPQIVADYIETQKGKLKIFGALKGIAEQRDGYELYRWVFASEDSQELFARAWLDGYTFEKDIVQYDVQEIINRSADLEELKGELVAYFNLKEVEK